MLVISGAATVNYTNDGGIPQITSTTSPNNPANFHWLVTDRGGTDVGRVNAPVEERETETTGGRFALTWGGDDLNLKFGAAYDEVSRDIRPTGADPQWSAAACGGNPSNFAVQPNAQPPLPRSDVGRNCGSECSRLPASRFRIRRTSTTATRSSWTAQCRAICGDSVRVRQRRLGSLRARFQLQRSRQRRRSGRPADDSELGHDRRAGDWRVRAAQRQSRHRRQPSALQRRRALRADRPVGDLAHHCADSGNATRPEGSRVRTRSITSRTRRTTRTGCRPRTWPGTSPTTRSCGPVCPGP